MPDIQIIAAITVILIYLRWEFLSPYIDTKRGSRPSKFQILLPFLGFVLAAILIQTAVNLDSDLTSFILLGIGSFILVVSLIFGIFRRINL